MRTCPFFPIEFAAAEFWGIGLVGVGTNDCWEFVSEIGSGVCLQNHTLSHIFGPGRNNLQPLSKPVKMMRMGNDMSVVRGVFNSVEI